MEACLCSCVRSARWYALNSFLGARSFLLLSSAAAPFDGSRRLANQRERCAPTMYESEENIFPPLDVNKKIEITRIKNSFDRSITWNCERCRNYEIAFVFWSRRCKVNNGCLAGKEC